MGYRDIHDANRFEVRDFSEDVAALTAFIHSVNASGGNDTPEDVAGGLFHSLNLSWDAEVKLLLFCADAPAHGRKYTPAGCDDEFPKGDPDGRDPCDLVAQLAQKGVDMTCFRCTDMVDPMISLFMAAHEEGAKRPGGAGADANFVLLNVKAANAAAAPAGAPRWGDGPPAVAACGAPPPGAISAFGVARKAAFAPRAGAVLFRGMPAAGGSGFSAAPCAPPCAPEEAPSGAAPSASDAFSEGLMASVERCMASAARRR